MKKPPAIYRPATREERALAETLRGCSFAPGTFVKRFARELGAQVEARGEITDRQARQLRIQAYRFRRQFPAHLVPSMPPEGYDTPAQREARHRLEEHLRKHSPAAPADHTNTAQPTTPTQKTLL